MNLHIPKSQRFEFFRSFDLSGTLWVHFGERLSRYYNLEPKTKNQNADRPSSKKFLSSKNFRDLEETSQVFVLEQNQNTF